MGCITAFAEPKGGARQTECVETSGRSGIPFSWRWRRDAKSCVSTLRGKKGYSGWHGHAQRVV